MVLHVQHYKPEDGDTFIARLFLDLHNQSVQVLAQKGISDAAPSVLTGFGARQQGP